MAAQQGVCFNVRGTVMTIRQISKAFGISEATIRARVKAGKTNDELIETAERGGSGQTFTVQGKTMTIRQISKKFAISEATLRARIKRGWVGDQLISDGGSLMSKQELLDELELWKQRALALEVKLAELQAN